ncbi:Nitrogenase molybdenum-iron protein, alpha and beta chain [uncultured Eubacteriales bacterium]|uniref:Nitrogenase molybdenum-iron protein, alpha and beta chain n=1 Tax=uncultured Eubacteriales bacterium TaxID=172733 RepID=A0A212JDD1_9FIRM|nr:Nitrogenase molybdenum-iron protein, alpha and beta chain [uncultured Eubacteriales bacterium]
MSKFVDRPRYGCAMSGALALLRAIPRTIPIIHSSTGCGFNCYNGTNAGSGYLGGGYCGGAATPSSNVVERHVVFGGEERLREQIESTLEVMDGDLYVVVTGCMVEMIGDDVQSVAQEFKDEGRPVIAVNTPSFQGNSYHGYELLFSALAREVVRKAEAVNPKKVNVLGLVPGGDVFYKGNLREIKRLLSLLGLEVNTFIGEGETLDDFKNAGDAALNLVLSDIHGVKTAQEFQRVHKTPYITTGLPIGYLQTAEFLHQVAKHLQISAETVETVLQRERTVYFDYFERLADIYNDIDLQRYVVVVADSNYAPSLARFSADELGWLPELTVITDFLEEHHKAALEKRFRGWESGLRPAVKFDTDAASVRHYLKEVWPRDRNARYFDALGPGYILGSVIEKELADEFQFDLLPVAFPVTNRIVFNRGYAGIRGGLTLAEDILGTLVAGR